MVRRTSGIGFLSWPRGRIWLGAKEMRSTWRPGRETSPALAVAAWPFDAGGGLDGLLLWARAGVPFAGPLETLLEIEAGFFPQPVETGAAPSLGPPREGNASSEFTLKDAGLGRAGAIFSFCLPLAMSDIVGTSSKSGLFEDAGWPAEGGGWAMSSSSTSSSTVTVCESLATACRSFSSSAGDMWAVVVPAAEEEAPAPLVVEVEVDVSIAGKRSVDGWVDEWRVDGNSGVSFFEMHTEYHEEIFWWGRMKEGRRTRDSTSM